MLLICTKKINHKKRVISSAIALIIIASSIAGAVFTAPVTVYALSLGGLQSTIASIIISLFLQCGAAPVNTNYLAALNSSYGYTIETAISEGLLTETAGGLVDSGLASAIEGASAYTELGLADIFTTTSADGAAVIASTGGVNIANTAINVGTAGTIGAFAGAVAVGVGAGVLINHIREYAGSLIKYGLPMSNKNFKDLVNNVPAGYDKCYYTQRMDNPVVTSYLCFYDSTEIAAYGFYSNNNLMGNVYNKKGDPFHGKARRILYRNETYESNIDYNPTNGPTSVPRDKAVGQNYDRIFENVTEMETYVNGLKNNNEELPIKPVVSPDIIGNLGNQYYDGENDSYPGLVNQVPEGADMIPVDMEDYQDFADNANNNTNNGDTGQPVQGDAFDDLIDTLIVDAPTIPDEPIIPDQPVDVPTVPDRPIVPE